MKSQAVRLMDVFVLGPFMVWAGTTRTLPKEAQAAMLIAGLLTIFYNGANYITYRARSQLNTTEQ